MTALPVPNVLPEIKEWLKSENEKIQKFWLYADWRSWARYDLYVHLEKTFGFSRDYIIRHGAPVWGDEDNRVADITVEPSSNNEQDKKLAPLAIRILTARPTENDTSFGNFAKAYQAEWAVVGEQTKEEVEGDYKGGKVLYLGLGEKDYGEEGFGSLKPEVINVGIENGVYGYYLYLDLPETT
jgi:hypothetical protein